MAFCSAEHRDSPVAVHKVVKVPIALVVRVPQLTNGSTVVLPQLRLVEKIVAIGRRRVPCRDAEADSHDQAV